MAEPYLNPDSNHFDPTSDEALERALEKVRAEARARVRERKKPAAEAASRQAAGSPAGRRDPSEYVERQPFDRRSRNRSTSPDRRESPPALATAPVPDAGKRKPASRKAVESTAAGISSRIGVRPALLFGLALAIICAVGMLSIRAIHSATPPIEGFATKPVDEPGDDRLDGTDDPLDAFNRPVTAALMRTQGWVLPRDVQTIDPALARARRAEFPDMAPEIALAPALEMDIDTTQDLNLLAMASEGEEPDLPLAPPPPPPPPQFGSLDPFAPPTGAGSTAGSRFKTGPRLALPPMRPFGPGTNTAAAPETADPLAGMIADQSGAQPLDNSIAAVQPAPPRQPAPSMIEQINQSRPSQTPAPPPPKQTVQRQTEKPVIAEKPPATLAQLQEASCSRLGFFSRISCKDEIRQEYCANRWNKHPDCTRLTTVNNF